MSTSDCAAQVRLEGDVYTSYGFTDRPAKKFSFADEAECHDVGRDAEGSVFPDKPRQVEVWSFGDYPTGEVLGVRFDEDTFAVYVAESVSASETERILGELGDQARG